MAGTPAPTATYFNLLQRVCDIALVATWTNASGATESVQQAFPRRFERIAAPYPLVLAYVSNDRYEYSQKYVDHYPTVTIQVWGGPVGAGYVGEMEDRVNYCYGAVTYEFERRPKLDSPTDGTSLDYLYPDDFAKLTDAPAGTTGFEVADGKGEITRYFGTEFMLSVHLRLPRSRLS